jgi:hypothetical protein
VRHAPIQAGKLCGATLWPVVCFLTDGETYPGDLVSKDVVLVVLEMFGVASSRRFFQVRTGVLADLMELISAKHESAFGAEFHRNESGRNFSATRNL